MHRGRHKENLEEKEERTDLNQDGKSLSVWYFCLPLYLQLPFFSFQKSFCFTISFQVFHSDLVFDRVEAVCVFASWTVLLCRDCRAPSSSSSEVRPKLSRYSKGHCDKYLPWKRTSMCIHIAVDLLFTILRARSDPPLLCKLSLAARKCIWKLLKFLLLLECLSASFSVFCSSTLSPFSLCPSPVLLNSPFSICACIFSSTSRSRKFSFLFFLFLSRSLSVGSIPLGSASRLGYVDTNVIESSKTPNIILPSVSMNSLALTEIKVVVCCLRLSGTAPH